MCDFKIKTFQHYIWVYFLFLMLIVALLDVEFLHCISHIISSSREQFPGHLQEEKFNWLWTHSLTLFLTLSKPAVVTVSIKTEITILSFISRWVLQVGRYRYLDVKSHPRSCLSHTLLVVTWPIPRLPAVCEKSIFHLIRYTQPVENYPHFPPNWYQVL